MYIYGITSSCFCSSRWLVVAPAPFCKTRQLHKLAGYLAPRLPHHPFFFPYPLFTILLPPSLSIKRWIPGHSFFFICSLAVICYSTTSQPASLYCFASPIRRRQPVAVNPPSRHPSPPDHVAPAPPCSPSPVRPPWPAPRNGRGPRAPASRSCSSLTRPSSCSSSSLA